MATERRRVYTRRTTADFASDEAIEDFAARLWQAFTQAEGIHMTTQVTERYADAVAYAVTAHAAQRRKGTDIPHIAHLLAVSGAVLEAGEMRIRRSPPCSMTWSRTRAACPGPTMGVRGSGIESRTSSSAAATPSLRMARTGCLRPSARPHARPPVRGQRRRLARGRGG